MWFFVAWSGDLQVTLWMRLCAQGTQSALRNSLRSHSSAILHVSQWCHHDMCCPLLAQPDWNQIFNSLLYWLCRTEDLAKCYKGSCSSDLWWCYIQLIIAFPFSQSACVLDSLQNRFGYVRQFLRVLWTYGKRPARVIVFTMRLTTNMEFKLSFIK
jgi:hypothetical protein